MTTRILTGQKELDRKLRKLETAAANRVAKAGLRSGSRTAAKDMRKQVPTDVKQIRKAIGNKVKTRRGVTTAKAGAGVGKKMLPAEPRKKRGVGIGARNVHWWVLGTGPRTTKAGKSTGKMPAHEITSGVSESAVASSIESASEKQLAKEVQRLGR